MIIGSPGSIYSPGPLHVPFDVKTIAQEYVTL